MVWLNFGASGKIRGFGILRSGKIGLSTKNEILPLTGLRFIAALYVFLFHFELSWPFSPVGVVGHVIAQGAVGMSVFFVLSGFLLAYQYSGRYEDKKSYFVRRLARIYPIYILAALITLPWIFGSQAGAAKLSAWDTAVLVVTNIFALQAWVPSYFKFWNNGGSWSISVEIFCYAMLPFIAPWMARLSNKKLAAFAAILCLCSVAPGQLGRVWPDLSFAFFYALPAFRLPEFLLGVCGFLAVQRGFRLPYPNLVVVIALLSFVVLINLRRFGLPYIGYNWFVLPVVVVLVVGLRQSDGRISRLLASEWFVWLGKISYCFYSFQVLVLLLLVTFRNDLIEVFPLLEINWLLCALAFFVLVVLSAIGHHFIEEPCRRKIQKWAGARDYKVAAKRVSYSV